MSLIIILSLQGGLVSADDPMFCNLMDFGHQITVLSLDTTNCNVEIPSDITVDNIVIINDYITEEMKDSGFVLLIEAPDQHRSYEVSPGLTDVKNTSPSSNIQSQNTINDNISDAYLLDTLTENIMDQFPTGSQPSLYIEYQNRVQNSRSYAMYHESVTELLEGQKSHTTIFIDHLKHSTMIKG